MEVSEFVEYQSVMTGLIKWWTSVGHAARGLRSAWASEANFRWHILILLVSAGLAAYLKFSTSQWIALVVIWGLVIVTELMNTAVEKLADIVQPDHAPEIGRVKDISAAAVLVASFTALVAGIVLFLPPILNHFADG